MDISPDEEEIFSVVRFMARVKERLKLSLLILNIAACGPLSNAVCAFVARPCPITEPYLIILRAIDENQPPERGHSFSRERLTTAGEVKGSNVRTSRSIVRVTE